jgi:glyoxylase-like metal-dependent hydrolase (beta-lactamase superfamily II)
MSDVYLKQLRVGPMANFVYLLGSKAARQCYVVDPAWDVQAIRDAAEQDGMTIAGALVTHYHPDHCGGHLWGHDIEGVAELQAAAGVPVYAHADEVDGIATVTGLARSDIKACRSGDKLPLGGSAGGLEITAIHTPGHTPGSQCFLCEGRLIAGDTLFLSGCGRVDLPGGSSEQLFESLSTKLAKLPPDTVLYPGHNYDDAPSATMADVARHNPYLSASTPAAWRRLFGA